MNSLRSDFQMNGRLTGWALLALLSLALAGCGRDDVKVYKVANDQSAPPASAPAAQPMTPPGDMTVPPAAQAGAPQLKWTLPDGWIQKPAEGMRLGSFSAPGKNGQLVDISIVPLSGMAGGDLNNVNRWRGQVGLAPITETDLAQQGQDVPVGDASARLYDMAGTPAGATTAARILAVGLHREDMMWFFKATGDEASVASQKDNFISFLKSIQFAPPGALAGLPPGHPDMNAALPAGHPDMSGTMPPAGATPDATAPAAGLPAWTVPAGWQTQPPTQMLLAKFAAAENGQQAEITVSSFPGDVGGLSANINRWRRQLSLPPADDAAVTAAVTALVTQAGPASLVDFNGTDPKTSQPARLVGVVLPLNGQTWFYKLMGDATVVEHQKAAFLQFVQSVKY
jgi:hypothetical protein